MLSIHSRKLKHQSFCIEKGVSFAVNEAFTDGGNGAVALANAVVEAIENKPSGDLKLPMNLRIVLKPRLQKLRPIFMGLAMWYWVKKH